MSKTNTIIYSIVLTAALALGFFSFQQMQQPVVHYSSKLGGDFTLPTKDGLFDLKDYRGKVVVLYFGYSSCPDVCPTALAMLGNTLKKMPEKVVDMIQPVFISVDPQRDTLDKLKLYGQYFHPKLIAGSTQKEDIDRLVKQYGAFYSISEQADSAMGYSVNHSSRLFLVDKQGNLAKTINHDDISKNLTENLLMLVTQE
jgi:protein SCO1/2